MSESLSIVVCGSVDDGKSSLIGRLLYETKQLSSHEIETINSTENYDFASLLDGLNDEAVQGITIDIAFRQININGRRITIIDCPGHEQYTRNMATGASKADVGIILIDASKSITEQTFRHISILSLFGIKTVVFIINKIDLVNYSSDKYHKIKSLLKPNKKITTFPKVFYIPVCATSGENIANNSSNMPWYKGKTLFSLLNNFHAPHYDQHNLLIPIQTQIRNKKNQRIYMGTISQGTLQKNQEISIYPSKTKTFIKDILLNGKSCQKAITGNSVAFTIKNEIDIVNNDIITSSTNILKYHHQFEAKLFSFSNSNLYASRQYIFKIANQIIHGEIIRIKNKINISTDRNEPSNFIEYNQLYKVVISLTKDAFLTSFKEKKLFGSFIMIDKYTNQTIACGVIEHPLFRSGNIKPQSFSISSKDRALVNKQKPFILWLTGLSGSGKSSIANQLNCYFHNNGFRSYILDGDNIRSGLNKDLGFTKNDRIENIRRISEVTKLFIDAGIIAIVSFISPFKSDRELAKSLVHKDQFLEIFIDTTLDECIKRDVKGLYKKAFNKKIINFTGIDSPYEPPLNPDIHIKTENYTVLESSQQIIKELYKNKLITL